MCRRCDTVCDTANMGPSLCLSLPLLLLSGAAPQAAAPAGSSYLPGTGEGTPRVFALMRAPLKNLAVYLRLVSLSAELRRLNCAACIIAFVLSAVSFTKQCERKVDIMSHLQPGAGCHDGRI